MVIRADCADNERLTSRTQAYITRFEAAQPNETRQSDFTHWRLADGSDAPIIKGLDDHSRLLLGFTVFGTVTGQVFINTFKECRKHYGTPFSTLTDNGIIFTLAPLHQ